MLNHYRSGGNPWELGLDSGALLAVLHGINTVPMSTLYMGI